MKKVLFAIPLALALTGCGSDIDLVKGGVMEFNQTTTLGKALDNWESCESREWEEFETDNGIKVVQFTCQHKISQYMSKAKSLLSEEKQAKAKHLDIASNIQTFQFTINQGDTFQLDNVQDKITWQDGTSFEDSQNPVEQLETAYANNLNFDPAELNRMGAAQIYTVFAMIKMRAKQRRRMIVISYWKNSKEIYDDDGLTLIIGWYDHKNMHNGGVKALGVHWGVIIPSRVVF